MSDEERRDGEEMPAEIVSISNAMTRMRVMMGRRMIGRLALEKVTPSLELSHLDVLDAIRWIGRDGEATVGAIAERMRIDPSRGSRLVADMVQSGVLSRLASQADGRRCVIAPTELGERLLGEIREIKRGVIMQALAGWPPEDVTNFARLYDLFMRNFEALFPPDARRAEAEAPQRSAPAEPAAAK